MTTEKSQLLEELRRSRMAITRDVAEVADELDVRKKISSAVNSRPFVWMGVATALGYLVAGPKTRTRTKTIVKKDGRSRSSTKPGGLLGLLTILLAALKIILPVVKPALTAYAARRMGDFAARLATK
jgi:hypothetical protein